MSWQRVRGHDAQVQAFKHVLRRRRLAHAYLFVGPPGVGKRLFADELAKTFLCEAPERGRFDACDACPACALVEAGTHPDLFVVSRSAETAGIPIETLRELGRVLALKPARGHGKIGIIDDADELNDPVTQHASANCFLKTLEEPPPRSLLILIGTSADLQLPTIVSRCQVVRFLPLADNVLADLLRAQGMTDSAMIERLVRFSNGSPGMARELADPALWDFRRRLLDTLVQPRPDTVALSRSWTRFVEEAGKEGTAQRVRAAAVLRLVIQFLQNAVSLSLGAVPKPAGPDDMRALEQLVKRTSPDQLLDLLERCLQAERQIDRRVQLVLILEALTDFLGQHLEGVAR